MRLLVGVDVGGTFTDAVAFDLASGQLWTAKARSTPSDQSEGFADALVRVLEAAGARHRGRGCSRRSFSPGLFTAARIDRRSERSEESRPARPPR